jgi:hypothetical protein
MACGNPFAPNEPWKAGAVAYQSPQLEVLWNKIEACSGVTGDFSAVRFYVVPQRFKVPQEVGPGLLASGVWVESENAIYLASAYSTFDGLIMHEEMHALLQRTDHPTQYFIHSACGPLM